MTPALRAMVAVLALVALSILHLPSAADGTDAPPAGFYRYPSIGGGAIVFASEGDLWKVPAEGGVAMRLTAYEGTETLPQISPDGRYVAFTAQYEGNDDVYVMSITGGEPVRLTFHPASDQVIGWTPDGRILFRSRRDHPHADFRLFAIAREGGIAERLPLDPAAWISFEPKGARVAYQKFGNEFHNWKRYKGGRAEEIYTGTLKPLAMRQATDWEGKDAFPMWASDGRVYFVTDRWGRPNLASMNPDGGDVRQLTRFDDFDVRWPAMGDGRIVFQHAMDIWSYDLRTGQSSIVPITLPSDRLQVRERFVDPMGTLGGWGLSPHGERIALETRGDVFVTRTQKKGLIRRITESSAARTKYPAFSPEGGSIAAWTEVDGEEQLLLYPADNAGAARQVGRQEPGWHYPALWSPDGKRLAWGDQAFRLMVMDRATGAAREADRAENEITEYAWSPDGRYLAYTAAIGNGFNQVKIWDSQTGKARAVSDASFNAYSPAWDPAGKYFAYLSDRWFNPYLDRFEARFSVMNSAVPIVASLQADASLPFAPRGDTDPEQEESKPKEKEKKDGGAGRIAIAPIRIDFDGIEGRVVQVPVTPASLSALRMVSGKLHWIESEPRGMMPADDESGDKKGGSLKTYDLEKRKLSNLADDVLGYDVSMDGKVLVYRTNDGFFRVDAGATSVPKPDKEAGDDGPKIDLGGWTVRITPQEEWKQMLREAWRLQRDFFYDPKMHGVDWNGVWAQYGPLADRISSRDDVEDLFQEMFGELSVGHAYHSGGDLRRGKTVGTGLLAADLTYDPASGFWQIQKIYPGDYPDPKTSSPLARPDLHVKPGMWLVAIDGKPLRKNEDYLKRLANRANQEVELSISATAKLDGARRIVIKPVASDTRIRYATWIHEARDYVDRASHGQIGYIHLYDMGGFGLQQFARDYPAQWNKHGLIIDDRWNHGGFVAPMIVNAFERKVFSVSGLRYGSYLDTYPSRVFHGYLATLINGQGGSDCETLALEFKDFGLGPVIGMRTWGGWVGIRGDKPLRDGGVTTQPEFGGWDPRGRGWQIEGHGVDPDVVLDLSPDGFMDGKDEQLDYAIQDLMKKIAQDPKNLPKAPPIEPRPLHAMR